MDQVIFSGHALNGIDGKNRLSIPAEFRETIVRRSNDRQVFIGPATGLDCLVAYDSTHRAEIRARLAAKGHDDDTADGALQSIFRFGGVLPFSFDDAGRIVLSAGMKDLADITTHVWFIAGGDWFQMWNPYRFLEIPGVEPRLLRILRREMAAKGLPEIEPPRDAGEGVAS
ncbi:hypothetical protein IP88_12805 [alpha proteobacterium AAP81b]|nr:hypothetical protein IP88_12805 [alpha proteobacterium AAP81b]